MRTLRRTTTLIILFCLVGFTAPVRAAAAPPTPLQVTLDQLVGSGVPGAMALQRNGEDVMRAAAGVSNLATGEPLETTDRFRIGSITKSMVSTAVLQLVGEGRLGLDDPVEAWLPGLVPNGDRITVRHLLNHTSGLADYIDLDFYLTILHDPLRTWEPRQLVERAVAQPPLFEPGTGWSYSNTGYVVLGLIVAKVHHLPESLAWYGPVAEVYARIIGPLRLWHTSFPVNQPAIHGPHSNGYLLDAPPEWGLPPVLDTTRFNPSWAWTAGAVISTLDETARFHRALFTGRLLQPAQQQDLQTTVPVAPGVLDYGLGVFRLTTPCGPAWGHDGGTPSHVSISLTSPDGSRQAVVMANRDANTWSPETGAAFANAYLTAFCGESVAATTALESAVAVLPDLGVTLR